MIKRTSNLDKNKTINRRLFILGSAKVGLLGLITSRLYNLQISEKTKYETLSDKNRFREWKTPPKRGVITDFYNNIIADNKRVYQVYLSLDETKDFNSSIFKLKNIIGLTNDELSKIYEKKQKIKPWDSILVSENLSWEKFSKLNLYLHEIEGAKPVLSTSRYYPYSNDLVHIIGYVGEASADDITKNKKIEENFVPGLKVGKIGIENSTDQLLIGNYGIKRFEVNSSGKKIREISYKKETQGENLRTTIDIEVQRLAQKLLDNKAGSICAMDIFSGEIIALASSPTYDPNKFTYGINKKDWNEIKNNKLRPLVNKSIAGLYSPGSTIKPLVALAALEYGIINPKLKVKCKGHDHPYELYGQKYHCWKKDGHGIMSLRNAIKQSCDIYFYEVARLLGVDKLSIIAKRYGLGSKVLENIFPEEKKGLVPSTKWKKQVLEQSWYLGETVITGIGQGYIQTTPIQLCLMTAQLANGGFKIYPKIVLDPNQETVEEIKSKMLSEVETNEEDIKSRFNSGIFFGDESKKYQALFRNKENVKFVLNAMFRSTNEVYGTSFSSRIEDPKYQFAGKTGTAQVKRITEAERELDLDTNQIPYKQRDHAWFIAFGPYKNPRYAMSILVEHGG